jgi:hypothetical protein
MNGDGDERNGVVGRGLDVNNNRENFRGGHLCHDMAIFIQPTQEVVDAIDRLSSKTVASSTSATSQPEGVRM